MDTPTHPLPDVPPMNFNAIRAALKAYGVMLIGLQCSVECQCARCGAEWSDECDLVDRFPKTWWLCWKCQAEEEG